MKKAAFANTKHHEKTIYYKLFFDFSYKKMVTMVYLTITIKNNIQ